MITPRTRLLCWTALLAVPGAGWLAAAPGPAPAALLLLWGGAAAWDAWQSRRGLRDIRIIAPETIRMARSREDNINLRLTCIPRLSARDLDVGLITPPALGVRQDIQTLNIPAGGREANVAWPALPRERGRFSIVDCRMQSPSRWGFWNMRCSQALTLEISVYPGMLSERHNAPALFLRRGIAGVRHQRRFGKGREFEQLREYQAGDSVEDIHWKATAKRGAPITKIFQVERSQEVYVAIDASRLSGRRLSIPDGVPAGDGVASPEDRLIERYINAALMLGRAAEIQGDSFGLLTFSDRLRSFVRARRGHPHYQACLDAVCRLRAEPVTPDFGEVFSFIRQRLRRRALIVLLTQLDDPVLAESFVRDIELIRRQHLVLACMPVPAIVQPLFLNPDAVHTDADIYTALGGHLRWRQLRDVSDALRKKGIGLMLMPDESMTASLVTSYINIKQRQIL